MATTDIQPDGLALAGLGLDKDLLLRVARILLADLYWDDDLESDYIAACQAKPKQFPYVKELMDRPETPQIQDEIDALIRMAGICGRIEQAWGESFYSVTRRILGYDRPNYTSSRAFPETQGAFDELQEELVYLTFMACIGHGIGPAGDSSCQWPEELDEAPIHIENPMLFQLSLLE